MSEKAIAKLGEALPIGFSVKGAEFSTFALDSVRGRLRREFFNLRKRTPGNEILCALKHVLTSLGPMEKPKEEFIKRLPLPDIDYIFLCVNANEGDGKIKWDFKCQTADGEAGCGAEMELAIDPYDIEIIPASPPIEFSEQGFPVQTIEFTDPTTGAKYPIKYKVATLGDQIKMFNRMNTGEASMGNFMFHQTSSMMLDYNNTGRGLTVEELDDLPVKTLDALLEVNNSHNPTQIDSELEITCSNCGMVHAANLPVDSWLVPFVKRRESVT